MNEYHKIQTVYKRDMQGDRSIIEGDFSCPEFEYLAHNRWIFTEKVDGMNIRIIWDGKEVHCAGKTDRAQIPKALAARLRDRFPDDAKFKTFFTEPGGGVCLYGEGYGAGIQKGGKYRLDPDFVLFDIKVGGWWLRRADVLDIAYKMRLDVIPVVGSGNLLHGIDLVRGGFKSQWGDFLAEGIVARPAVDLRCRSGERIITKIKHRDFA